MITRWLVRSARAAAVLACAGVCGCGPEPPSPQATEPDQWVVVYPLEGAVFVRTDRADANGAPAGPPAEAPTKLRAGQSWVRCDPGGKARVLSPTGARDTTSQTWEAIPYTPARRQSDAWLTHADKYFRRAGRLRGPGEDSVVYAPAPGNLPPEQGRLARPTALTFRWRPLPAGTAVTLTLRENSTGKALWEKAGVDGAAGRLDAEDAREALTRWRGGAADPDAEGRLAVEFVASGGVAEKAYFGLLPADREGDLDRRLGSVAGDTPAGAFRHLGRSAVFHEFRLPTEAADEAEAAVRLDPADPWIRETAVASQARAGNSARARELRAGAGR